MIDRLTRTLRPERACEEEVIEVAAALPNAYLLADLIVRATKREWLHGSETGRREMAEELAESRAHNMA